MSNDFMLSDLAAVSESILLFAIILLIPGYVAAWSLNLMAFRQRTLPTRMILAVPISIGICPAITYLLWRFFPPGVPLFYTATAIAFVLLLVKGGRGSVSSAASFIRSRRGVVCLAVSSGWIVVATLSLVDLQIGHRLYFPTVTYDYSFRTAVTAAIGATGAPAHNPYFFAGRYFALRYHYFWFILCSVVQRIGGSAVTPRQAMIASTVWCGLGLLAMPPLYLRFFQSKGAADLDRRMWLGIGLIAVTGLDILPVVFLETINRTSLGSIEWWNDQITAWVGSVLWVPHHIAGLIACLMGFLVIWNAGWRPAGKERIAVSATAGVMFASAPGLSIYVTIVFAVFLVIWMVISWLRGYRAHAALICASGAIAVAISGPYIGDLLAGGSGSGVTGGAPFEFAVKPLRIFDLLLGLSQTGGWKTNLANLFALPLNYGLELGFFLIVALVCCRRMWRNRHSLTEDQLCTLTMTAASAIVCTFVRSKVVTDNDLGWRGFLIAQFVLLIWGAELLNNGFLTRGALNPGKRFAVLATLVLGVAGTAYEIVKIRFYPVLSDTTSTQLDKWLSPDRQLGARTYALRQTYEELKRRTPPNAVFQHNPDVDPEDLFHGMYADRQVAAETMNCAVVFGGDAGLCHDRIGLIDDLFEHPAAIQTAQIDDICDRLSINILVVKDTDRVWSDPQSWVWHRKPLLANDYARAFDCGVTPPLSARAQ